MLKLERCFTGKIYPVIAQAMTDFLFLKNQGIQKVLSGPVPFVLKKEVRTMEPGASCQIIILKKGLKNYDENITDSHTGKLYFCQLSDRAKSCTGVHGKA